MRIFKIKAFHRWAKSERVTDKMLKNAVTEIIKGLVEADLGAGLFKKRIARSGEGKRGGYRTLLGYRENKRSVFFFGFTKNDMDDVEDDQKKDLKYMSSYYLNISDCQIELFIKQGELIEVK
ncbi:MAG TPA: type II toxin-antitoxin system RelE/ParE family toxin [Coxiellaceae bacterium]|nr:MAG: hypothetical protein A3E81_00180 [Gammaproteobacteria bacterium RIFCSPHIGHO2_12_FULL_36_30]HLB56578.1 type II toxin-antitoxin system RelE/ParE family toxin [Coxiellaceae bacterium]